MAKPLRRAAFVEGEHIATGSYGAVYKCIYEGRDVCAKVTAPRG
jgi:hypothetical protein